MVNFLPANGTRLRVEEAGSGPDLLFLHAGIADRRMWNPQWDWLSRYFHCVRYDHRGLGESPLVPGPFSYADDALAVMDAFCLKQAILIGCSFGGTVAIHLAATLPGRVDKLVLAGSGLAGFDAGVPQPEIFAEAEQAWSAKDWERVLAIDESVWVVGLHRHPEDLDPDFLAFAREMNRTSLRYLDVPNESQDDFDDTPLLAATNIPTLVIVGSEDLPDILAKAEHLAVALPKARLVRMEDAAHLPNLERPNAFNGIIAPFLGVPLPQDMIL